MEYIEGVLKFVEFASKHASDGENLLPLYEMCEFEFGTTRGGM